MGEPDMSWIDIAVSHSKEVFILGYSEGWKQFDMEHWWEDTFSTDAPDHLAPGAYRWAGFVIGSWDEDEHIFVTKGEFSPIPSTPSLLAHAEALNAAGLFDNDAQFARIKAKLRAIDAVRGGV